MVAAPLASGLHFPSSPLQPLAELEEDITCPPFQGWKRMSEDKEAHDPTKSLKQLHTEWLQWLKDNEPTQQAKFVDIKDRRKEKSELSFNKNFKQVNLYLRRGDFHVLSLERMILSHPMLAIGSLKRLTGLKVNQIAPQKKHESSFDLRWKFRTVLGWHVTMGYSRYKDQDSGPETTRLWCKFGFNCSYAWQHKMMTDLMLHVAGYESLYGYPHGSHWRPKIQSKPSNDYWRLQPEMRPAKIQSKPPSGSLRH